MKKLKNTIRNAISSVVTCQQQHQIEFLKPEKEYMAMIPMEICNYIAALHFRIIMHERLEAIWKSLLDRCEFQNYYHHSKLSDDHGVYKCNYTNVDDPILIDISRLCFFRPQSVIWHGGEIIGININIIYPPENSELLEGVSFVFNLPKHVETRTNAELTENTDQQNKPPLVAICIGGIPQHIDKRKNNRNLEKSKRVKVY